MRISGSCEGEEVWRVFLPELSAASTLDDWIPLVSSAML